MASSHQGSECQPIHLSSQDISQTLGHQVKVISLGPYGDRGGKNSDILLTERAGPARREATVWRGLQVVGGLVSHTTDLLVPSESYATLQGL